MEDITHFLLPISHQPIPDGVCRLLETGIHFRELQHWSIYLPLPKHPGEQVTQWVDDALRGCGSSVHASLSRTVGWQLERAWWGDTAPEQRDLRRFPLLCLLVVRLGKTTQPLEVSASSFDSVVQVK